MNEPENPEQVDIKKLPYEYILQKEGLKEDELPNHTKQLIADLNRTTNLLVNASKGEEIKMTAKTEQKIKTYDRYICDGIFEYLEDKEEKAQAIAKEEAQKKEYIENLDSQKESVSELEPEQESETSSEKEQEAETPKKKTPLGLGFWDW